MLSAGKTIRMSDPDHEILPFREYVARGERLLLDSGVYDALLPLRVRVYPDRRLGVMLNRPYFKLTVLSNGTVRVALREQSEGINRWVAKPTRFQVTHHINGDPWDNRIANLSNVSRAANASCRTKRKSVHGSNIYHNGTSYYCRLQYANQQYNSPMFVTQPEAVAWREAKYLELHGHSRIENEVIVLD